VGRSKLYEASSAELFKLSRNKIEEYVRCPRCLVLNVRHGLRRPSSPPFTLNSAVDSLLKKEFDRHREAQTVHPLVAAAGLDLVPFQHEEMDEWRNNFKGIQIAFPRHGFLLTGAVDDIWVNSDGELVIVDYKATAKASPMIEVPMGGFYDSYRRQLDFYRWLLRQRGFNVSETSYWLYCTGRPGANSFDQRLEFDLHLIAYDSDDSWIEPTLDDLHSDLIGEGLPKRAESCEHCTYTSARESLEAAWDFDAFPRCYRCGQIKSRTLIGLPAGPPPPHHFLSGCLIDPDNPTPAFVCENCDNL